MAADQREIRRAMDDAMRALGPVLERHGATLGLCATAQVMGLLLVKCHRAGAVRATLGEVRGAVVRRFEEAVGRSAAVAVEMDRRPGGRA